ncbi:hypothetical protein KIL84_022636 [Mauremys mutica]|uniref:Transmembrane protein 44 n=1 Tax=Mauremys mutica TaxID=74926 RepID=A0A9D3WQ37_9SAUR|nr:hypothetical protein KIL84_022636 [Mauremys mutica]
MPRAAARRAPASDGAAMGAAAGSWGHLAACLARDRACASAALGGLAALLWMAAHGLLVRARCRRKDWQEVSVLCIIYSFVGSMCNTIGALLAQQLAIQVFTGAYMAAVDIIHFLLTLFPVCASDPRPAPAPPGRRKRRRRQVRSSLLALALPLCTGPGWYVLAMATSSSPEEFHGAQRRLLGTALQENTEVLGFALGMLAALVAFTARIPALSGACRGRLSPVTQHWASISSALASVLYAAAIVTHDQRPAYFVRAMPWLLLSLGSAALDVAIACLSCLMKSQMSQRLGLVAEATETPAAWALLAQAEEEEEPKGTEEEKAPNWLPLSMFPAPKSLHEGAAVGRCLDLTIEQVQQWDFGDMNIQWNRNGTEAPNLQPGSSSVLNAGFGFDVNALKQTAAALRLCDNDAPWAEKS